MSGSTEHPATTARRPVARRAREATASLAGSLRDLLTLTKPGVVVLCVVTAAAGFCLAAAGGAPVLSGSPLVAVFALIGTALAVASANALNMYLERDTDGLMARTRHWPLPAGRVTPRVALVFGLACGAAALTLLWIGANPLSALLAALALGSYVLIYTPLKRRTPFALHVGTLPGALPALIGWSAATGSLDWPALALFLVLVLWQVPHFIAIAIYRAEDYQRAGIKALPLLHGNRWAHIHSVLAAVLLVPAAALPTLAGANGQVYLGQTYLVSALAASLWLLTLAVAAALRAWRRPTSAREDARRLFYASMVYLPLLYAGIFVEMIFRWPR